MNDTLCAPAELMPGEERVSANGRYRLIMQYDGNLVVYRDRTTPIWSSNTDGNPLAHVQMQEDGNLVLYSGSHEPLRATGTCGSDAHLIVQDDGNLVVYDGDDHQAPRRALWSANHNELHIPPPPPRTSDLDSPPLKPRSYGPDLDWWYARAEAYQLSDPKLKRDHETICEWCGSNRPIEDAPCYRCFKFSSISSRSPQRLAQRMVPCDMCGPGFEVRGSAVVKHKYPYGKNCRLENFHTSECMERHLNKSHR